MRRWRTESLVSQGSQSSSPSALIIKKILQIAFLEASPAVSPRTSTSSGVSLHRFGVFLPELSLSECGDATAALPNLRL